MKYYKMIPRKRAEALVTRGSVKIKTLFECKAAEFLAGKGRSDPEEGDIFHDMTIPSVRNLSPEEQADPQTLQELWEQGYEPLNMVGMEGEWVQVQTRRVWHFQQRVRVLVARRQHAACELKFWTGEDDVWVEIDPGPFFAALNDHMQGLGHTALGVHDIRYRPRLFGQNLQSGHPATVKPRGFKNEHETRAIWQPGPWPVK